MRKHFLSTDLDLTGAHVGDDTSGTSAFIDEQRRRDIWNFKHDFGAEASDREKELEMAHRRLFKSAPQTLDYNDTVGRLEKRSESPPRSTDDP